MSCLSFYFQPHQLNVFFVYKLAKFKKKKGGGEQSLDTQSQMALYL
jgi:hypothetical protein